LRSSEPDLLEKLPAHLKAEVENLLAVPGIVARTHYLEDARLPLIKRLNQRIGYHIRDLAEFEQVVGIVRQNSSRGAVGEVFARRFVAGELTASLDRRKPHFPKELYGGDKNIQPDIIRPLSRRTLDVKVGYSEGEIDDDQLERYTLLVQHSQQASSSPLQARLEELGLEGGGLDGHDYLFLPDGSGKTREAATRAYRKIADKQFAPFVQVYYVAAFLGGASSKVGVYLLELNELDEVVATFIGDKLPD